MRSLVRLGLFLLLLSSCSDKLADEQYVSFNESLEKSNRAINYSTGYTNAVLETKQTELPTHYKAQIWWPKAKLVTKFTFEIYEQLESLKKGGSVDIDSIFRRIRGFKALLLAIEPIFKEVLDNYPQFPEKFPATEQKKFKELFSGVISLKDRALLSQLQNHIKIIENRLIRHCNEQVSNNSFIIDTRIPLVVQSHSVVKPGQQVELTAGIGSFSNDAMPTVTIGDRKIKLDENASANYIFNAPQKPGKYTINVQIEYVGDDGKPAKASKIVEYTVAQCN